MHNYPNYPNFKIHIFLTFSGGVRKFQRKQSHTQEVYVGCNVKIHLFRAYTTIVYSELRTYTGCRDNSRIRKEVYAGCNVESHIFKAYVGIIYSKSHTYAGFLKETHVHIKKAHF